MSLQKIGFVTLACLALAGCLDMGSDAPAATTATPGNPPPNNPPAGPSNSAPTISGNPAPAVNVGDTYSFTPSASDADGDTLTFSIQNQPSWASFDSSSGEISGTPELGDVGMYSGISISVSDGTTTASTSAFSVEVSQVQLGSVTLSWSAPTQNSDGSALTDLAAFKIYYGNSQGSYPNQIQIDNAGTTTYVVDNLAPNTYFFVATAVNSQGIESQFSDPAQIVVN